MTEGKQAPPHRVIAVYGALRSGTTLFRLLLDAHPEISCPGERDFMLDHLKPSSRGLCLDKESLQLDRIFRAAALQIPETEDGAEAFFDMVSQQIDGKGGVLVLILHRKLDRLLELMPDMPIIHLVRDPRDVARSSIGMGWAANTWHGIDHWLHTERDWDRLAHRISPEQVLDLRYEDLVEAPETNLAGLCDFMGLAYDPVMMTFSETSTYSAIDSSLCYQWKRKQTEYEVGVVEHKVGSMLVARGYAPSGFDIKLPSAFERLRLWAETKSRVWKLRFERFGYIDPVIVYLASKVGAKSFARGPQFRIDQKTIRHLK